tara:strand:+ start:1330 stop:2202 length:873 start_codon:yes stop_codon:yes gene_type:complete
MKKLSRKELRSLIKECIIVGGQLHGSNFLGKTRDRNYKPDLEIIRKLSPNGVEIVFIHDQISDYLEGMNSAGIGIVNAALLVSEDEKAAKSYWGKAKKKGASKDGPRMAKALECDNLRDCIKSLITYEDGIKGHTFVGDGTSIYSIEMTSKHNPVIKKIKLDDDFTVRTNHGHDHKKAGYTPDGFPEDYISSKIRQAAAEDALRSYEGDYEKIMPSIAKQYFEPNSNYNMLRKVNKKSGMKSSSQVLMNLKEKEMICYLIPDECNFTGIHDETPEDYTPKINLRMMRYKK